MPPRLNKRQLREQAELEELEKGKAAGLGDAVQDEEAASDDEGSPQLKTASTDVTSAFGALEVGGGDEDEDDSDEPEPAEQLTASTKKKSKSKKKKKKTAAAGTATTASANDSAPASQPGTPSRPPSKSKKVQKVTKATAAPADDIDEIDRALAEIAQKAGGATAAEIQQTQASAGARLTPEAQAVKSLYAFEPKLLDSDAELRKMFGSKVVSAQPAAVPRSPYHARLANNPHHSTSIKRTASFLANPESGWYPPTGVLKLKRYEGPETETEPSADWWTFDHPVEYRASQLAFLEVLQQADGNRLYNVLQNCPYHVDTHMQLSEMQTQQGDLGASSTHLSKALYAMSQPLPPSFPSGSFRLPYSQIENRAFFLGIARKVAILTKRGTWRTACEWAKIGLGVGGGTDPVGMLAFIDFLAPKARQNGWFLEMLEVLPKAYAHQPEMRLESYPGLAYAKALCLKGIEEDKGEDDTKSTAALKSAILRFPMVVPLLFATLGGNVPPKLLSHRRAQVDGAFTTSPSYLLSLLSSLYATRSGPLWKPPPILAWLQKTAQAAADSLDDKTLEDVRLGVELFDQGPFEAGTAPAGVIRAAYISDIPSIRPYIPPSVLSRTSYSHDPVPPSASSGATFYDESYLAPLYSSSSSLGRRRNRAQERRAAQNDQAAARGMRDQLAQLLGIGPAGPQVDMNPELRAELLAELEALGGGGAGGLPGGFPGREDDDDDEGEDDGFEDEDEDDEGGEGDERQPEAAGNVFARLAAFLGAQQQQQPPAGPQD